MIFCAYKTNLLYSDIPIRDMWYLVWLPPLSASATDVAWFEYLLLKPVMQVKERVPLGPRFIYKGSHAPPSVSYTAYAGKRVSTHLIAMVPDTLVIGIGVRGSHQVFHLVLKHDVTCLQGEEVKQVFSARVAKSRIPRPN